MATPSIAGTVSGIAGTTQTVTVTFTSSDSRIITNLSLGAPGAAVPYANGWGGPASFTCPRVSTGSGCLLNLSYAPVAPVSGNLVIDFGYTDDDGTPQSGSLTLPYASTASNNALAATAPAGQVNAIVGASQSVTVSFTTDDGNPATALSVTSDLTALPAGWSASVQALSCASVSTGSGCQLHLTYAPTANGDGTLTLNFGYTNNAGAAEVGAVNIAYAATAHDNVVGTVSPSGQVNAIAGATVPVVVTFDTDDGNTASGLSLTTDLTALPAGWTSTANALTCSSVSTGNGCQLPLSFAPTGALTGTLALAYNYTDATGTAKSGTVNIDYAATTHDNVVTTVSPSGQVNAVVGSGTQTVLVTFTTDDGAAASGLSVTSGLSSLPPGWTLASNATCASVSTGNGCQLGLSFAPTVRGSGTLSLTYGYTDNAGTAKTGTVSIPYAATTQNNAVSTAAPSGTVSVIAGQTQPVTVTFTTDDANPASALTVTAGLGSLPAGWSGPNQFSCSSFGTGTGCRLSLSYAPVAAGSGTLSLSFSYADDSGGAKTGSVSIPYSAILQHVYVVDEGTQGVLLCSQGSAGALVGCTATGSGLGGATGLSFSGNFAYVSLFNNNAVMVCAVAGDGTFSGCTGTGSNFTSPTHSSVQGSYFYVGNANNPGLVTSCLIDAGSGALSGCTRTAAGSGNNVGGAFVGDTYAYVNGFFGPVYQCATNSDGTLGNCATTASTVTGAMKVTLSGGYAYMATSSGASGCAIDTNGALINCVNTNVDGSGDDSLGIAVSGTDAYVIIEAFDFSTFTSADDVYHCTLSAASLTGCAISDGGGTYQNLWDVVIH